MKYHCRWFSFMFSLKMLRVSSKGSGHRGSLWSLRDMEKAEATSDPMKVWYPLKEREREEYPGGLAITDSALSLLWIKSLLWKGIWSWLGKFRMPQVRGERERERGWERHGGIEREEEIAKRASNCCAALRKSQPSCWGSSVQGLSIRGLLHLLEITLS